MKSELKLRISHCIKAALCYRSQWFLGNSLLSSITQITSAPKKKKIPCILKKFMPNVLFCWSCTYRKFLLLTQLLFFFPFLVKYVSKAENTIKEKIPIILTKPEEASQYTVQVFHDHSFSFAPSVWAHLQLAAEWTRQYP